MVLTNVLEVKLERDKDGRYTKVSSEIVKKDVVLLPKATTEKGINMEKLKQKLLDSGVISNKSEVE